MVFFTTKFPQHLFEIARTLGYKRKDPDFFIYQTEVAGIPYEESVGNLTAADFESWLFEGDFGSRHPKIAELLTCPGCFSMQLGLWLGLIMAIAIQQWWMWPIAFVSWPSAGRLIFKKI